ncbi:iron ABC transporter permease [Actinomadura sp. ATCC 31491]|uniref:Iron ABC transporter permease n=1 Tax=Actinomadura luzonensis TaxID=2805427 RepID=A0ABT0G3H6_9ACTN|nr:iron ABC transporter permease [Actinomadura luzonensis]MCK2218683.1 iron ABC transporter permease [Actinomadura luzonensis]
MTRILSRSPARARPARSARSGRPARPGRSGHFVLLVAALAAAGVAATCLAVSIGAVHVALPQAWGIVADRLVPGVVPRTWTPVQEQIVWEFRLPRALLALLVGAGLSVVGAVLQALVRNPLADPFLLGISSGASFGAVLVLVVGAVTYLLLQHRQLNALAAGEETAVSLGVPVGRLRLTLFVLTSLLVGVLVATSGAIAFVGLIVPHAARLLTGADHRRVLPVSALLGAVFLQLADIAARTVDAPRELALSVVTALFGVPFFLWLLRRRSVDRAVSVT